MADVTEAQLAAARDILIGAIAAAGPGNAGSFGWKARVAALVPEVSAMMEPGARMLERALLCMDAQFIAAEYLGYTLEESSTRLVVSLKSDRNDEVETIRTERTDVNSGALMREKLDHLEVGRRILVRKVMEPMHNQPGRSVRVMMHFESLPPRKDRNADDAPGGSTPTAAPVPRRSDPEASSTGASGSPADRSPQQVVQDILDGKPVKVRNALSKALVVNHLWPVTADNLDKALLLVTMETP